jgi:hypothetical protein
MERSRTALFQSIDPGEILRRPVDVAIIDPESPALFGTPDEALVNPVQAAIARAPYPAILNPILTRLVWPKNEVVLNPIPSIHRHLAR